MTSQQLHGWKDIAGYLGRSVRAAQRWEKHLGLPVHRLPTQAGHAIFAIPAELDAWRIDAERRHADVFKRLSSDEDPDSVADDSPDPDEAPGEVPAIVPQAAPHGDAVGPRRLVLPSRNRTILGVVAASLLLVLVLGLTSLRTTSTDDGPPAADLSMNSAMDAGPWPTQGADARRSAQGRFAGPQRAPSARVLFDAGASHFPYSGPIVATSLGTFIVGTCDGRIVSFDREGRISWTQMLDRETNPEAASGLTLTKSLLLVSVGDCPHARHTNARTHFTALGFATGELAFRHRSGAQGVAAMVGRDGAIYQGDQYGTLRKFDSLGSVLWTVDFAGFGLLAPLQAADGRLLVVGDGSLFGQESRHIVTPDGRIEWQGGEGYFTGASLLPNGDLVAVEMASDVGGVRSGTPSVRAFGPSGRELWRVDIPEGFPPSTNPEVATPLQGGVIVRSATHLVAISNTGAVRWRTPLPGQTGAQGPIVDRNGDIYVGAARRVLAFRPDGTPRWDVALSVPSSRPLTSEELGVGDSQRLIVGGNGLLVAVVGRTVVALQ